MLFQILTVSGTKVVGASGFEARPLSDGASARPLWLPSGRAAASPRVGILLWPAGGRVLPLLLTSERREVHERVAVVHCLYAAAGRPVGFEDAVAVPYVAHEVEQADLAPDDELFEGGLC